MRAAKGHIQVVDEIYEDNRDGVDREIKMVDEHFFREKPEDMNPYEVELTNLLVQKEQIDHQKKIEEEVRKLTKERKKQMQMESKISAARREAQIKKKVDSMMEEGNDIEEVRKKVMNKELKIMAAELKNRNKSQKTVDSYGKPGVFQQYKTGTFFEKMTI